MKTPMQELIEQFENRLSSLREVQATARKESKYLLEIQIGELEVSILSAELMLEKQKEMIVLAHINGQSEFDNGAYRQEVISNAEQYYNETFNTKER